MIVAGIDIGSNATRLTVSKAPTKGGFHKPDDLIEKYRFPCRLGNDVFTNGYIGDSKTKKMDYIFSEIKNLLKKHHVQKTKAVATSAFRDAENGKELLETLSAKYEIPSSIVCGIEEAKLMSQGLKKRNFFTDDAAHLHIDIGGGSLELSCYHKGEFLFQESLDLGTLRLINNTTEGLLVSNYKEQLSLIDDLFKQIDVSQFKKLKAHGTGGNFKRLGTLRQQSSSKKQDDKIKASEIPKMIELYSKYSGQELSKHTPIKPDNAALIVPSLLIIERILKFWPAKKIKIPKLSLSHVLLDGLG